MGTWGPGNFDDDTVADGLSEITDDLIAKIAEVFADEDEVAKLVEAPDAEAIMALLGDVNE